MKDTKRTNYRLNPDKSHTERVLEQIRVDIDRYGYAACPCRLIRGDKEANLDIICPCDYRDADVDEFGSCFCGLYVSDDVFSGKTEIQPVPDRRKMKKQNVNKGEKVVGGLGKLSYPVYRCKVCGYLCAKENPPAKCPICQAGAERFERFI